MLSFDDINKIEYLKGSLVYINKNDLNLDDNTFLSIDLIGFNVIIDNKNIGIIKEVLDTPANEVLVLDNNVMIPYVKEFIDNINTNKKTITIKNIKGLI